MTYPDNPMGLQSTGFFTTKGKKLDQQRERLAAIAMQWFNKCQNDRISQERQWYLNMAFYYGNQHVQFRQTSNGGPFDLYVPKAPYYRVRITINQIRRTIRKEISRLTAQKPNAYVVPSSTEDADVFAAQAAEQIWDSLWRRLKFNKTLREAVFWQSVCGTAFIKTYWDSTRLDPESGKYGDICIANVSPFHIFAPDPLLTEIEDQPYIIHAQQKSKSWIRRNYGVEAHSDKLDSVDEMMHNVMNISKQDSGKDSAIILEVWVKPGYLPELPNGGMYTVAAGQVVQGFDYWPYEHGEYPFSKLDGIPTGKFYTSSIIEDLIPLQKELNRSRAQIIESKNRMSKPQLTAQKGAVDPKKITSEPGQVIEYEVGFDPPQPLPIQGLPSYVNEEINRLYTDISDLSGQHEVSNGSTPPGVTAATAISFLQEQDETMTAPHYSSLEEAIEKIAKQALIYVKMYWDEARTVKVVGVDGSFDVQTFMGADLRSNTDVRIESGSALPTSRAAKQAFIMDLMKMGFIPPEEGLEIMEVGGLNKVYDRIKIDKRQAQRENLRMRVVKEEDVAAQQEEWNQKLEEMRAKSDPNMPDPTVDPATGLALEPPLLVPVHTYDNHEIHIKVHNDYRKSQAFESASPHVKAIFEEHVNQHNEALANQMVHPLTGMDPSDPNAPPPEEEEAAMDQMEQEGGGQEQSSGPSPMPELEGEAPSEGM